MSWAGTRPIRPPTWSRRAGSSRSSARPMTWPVRIWRWRWTDDGLRIADYLSLIPIVHRPGLEGYVAELDLVTQRPGTTSLRLATYNVHLGGARQATAQLWAEGRLNVLCLQEARDPARLPGVDSAQGRTALWQAVPGGTWGSGLL